MTTRRLPGALLLALAACAGEPKKDVAIPVDTTRPDTTLLTSGDRPARRDSAAAPTAAAAAVGDRDDDDDGAAEDDDRDDDRRAAAAPGPARGRKHGRKKGHGKHGKH